MADPSGRVFANRELGHYLLTRKGNCFTMPLLAVILGAAADEKPVRLAQGERVMAPVLGIGGDDIDSPLGSLNVTSSLSVRFRAMVAAVSGSGASTYT